MVAALYRIRRVGQTFFSTQRGVRVFPKYFAAISLALMVGPGLLNGFASIEIRSRLAAADDATVVATVGPMERDPPAPTVSFA